MHPLPLSDVKAIRKQIPKLGAHHIVLVQRNGLTLGPFYFGSGGVRALFSCLKQVLPIAVLSIWGPALLSCPGLVVRRLFLDQGRL